MILPKGIVVNSPEALGQIERIDREPLKREEIARFWKVYTTTGRRLRDPTAERLENYWWRIWGSRKKELKGATVARLFAQISDGESFVPLRSSVNRDEGTPPPNNRRPGPVTSSSSTTALHHRPSTTSTAGARLPPNMPPPILKKSRGPSTTGPRPTARFISPHDSEVESDAMSPMSATNSHVVVQPPSRAPSPDAHLPRAESKRLAPNSAAKKKSQGFVASTAAKKKRPLIVRRASSQTSQTSQSSTDSASKPSEVAIVQDDANKSKNREGQESKSEENFSPATINSLSPRKRQVLKPGMLRKTSPRKPLAGPSKKPNSPHVDTVQSSVVGVVGEPGSSSSLRPVQNGQTVKGDLTPEEMEELEVQRLLLQEFNRDLMRSARTPPPQPKSQDQVLSRSPRSRSDGVQSRKETNALRLLPGEAKSTVGIAPTLTSVTAELVEPTNSQYDGSAGEALDKGKGRDPEELKRAELFAKRPVQLVSDSTATPGGPSKLSKSKSQLTLLLEKDRARSEEQKKAGKRRERSTDDKRWDKR
ncbi:hypothetical protein BP5796_09641 [Coleophoma crateriformis]|uniref:Nitrogen regulatory protein areA GATA-like domain-containing protein n=1 Tax=Coleophoma crateriformis TaxID=565419 RepID=A0A3D8QYL3_9HELO|nr:hypothetical protein BP5796_09641 [Coleophoma crateriformis]